MSCRGVLRRVHITWYTVYLAEPPAYASGSVKTTLVGCIFVGRLRVRSALVRSTVLAQAQTWASLVGLRRRRAVQQAAQTDRGQGDVVWSSNICRHCRRRTSRPGVRCCVGDFAAQWPAESNSVHCDCPSAVQQQQQQQQQHSFVCDHRRNAEQRRNTTICVAIRWF